MLPAAIRFARVAIIGLGSLAALDLAMLVLRSQADVALFGLCLALTAAAHLALAAAFARMQRRARGGGR